MTKHHVVINGVVYIPAPEQPAESTLTEPEKANLKYIVDRKGLHYSMIHFSNFNSGGRYQIDDKRFHQLRAALVIADAELESYLREKGIFDV